ncbi:hypothetical protein [Coleofasciculus sp.]|uniref:hypothetical protein n=1 Tax=Coleofasciculus sp. TaxID=3100458 RepID=UPI0039F9517A
MNKLLIAVTLSLSILLEALGGNSVGALTIRSWNSANQRGGDLFNAGNGTFQYSAFSSSLLERSHTILSSDDFLYNSNNQKAYLNFIESKQLRIPVPETSTVLALLTLGICAVGNKFTKN